MSINNRTSLSVKLSVITHLCVFNPRRGNPYRKPLSYCARSWSCTSQGWWSAPHCLWWTNWTYADRAQRTMSFARNCVSCWRSKQCLTCRLCCKCHSRETVVTCCITHLWRIDWHDLACTSLQHTCLGALRLHVVDSLHLYHRHMKWVWWFLKSPVGLVFNHLTFNHSSHMQSLKTYGMGLFF